MTMETWQAILLLLIGADVMVQLLRYAAEYRNKAKIDMILALVEPERENR